MNQDQTLKLQSYLDGELSPRESRQIAELLAVDADARAIYNELKFMKDALKGNEVEVKLPESREFFFSKIASQIEREAKQAENREPVREPFFAQLRKYFLPLTGAAAAAIAFMVMSGNPLTSQYAATEFEDSDTMTANVFRSQSDRMTVVWLEEAASPVSEESSDVPDSELN